MGNFTSIPWVHNWFLPTALGLAVAIITALSNDAIPLLSDGLDGGDWGEIGSIVLNAGITFMATLATRYMGGQERWGLPAKQPEQVVTNEVGDAPH